MVDVVVVAVVNASVEIPKLSEVHLLILLPLFLSPLLF